LHKINKEIILDIIDPLWWFGSGRYLESQDRCLETSRRVMSLIQVLRISVVHVGG